MESKLSKEETINFNIRKDSPNLFLLSLRMNHDFVVIAKDDTIYKMKIMHIGKKNEGGTKKFFFKANCHVKVEKNGSIGTLNQNFTGHIDTENNTGSMKPIEKIEW